MASRTTSRQPGPLRRKASLSSPSGESERRSPPGPKRVPVSASRKSQQQFYEIFGSRDYDCFKTNEDKYLKLKIAMNLFGLPKEPEPGTDVSEEITVSSSYDKTQNKIVTGIFKKIEIYRDYDEDEIYLASLFNCCEIKKRPSKKSPIESVTEEAVFPIMRVKTCFGGRGSCCVFIDEYARVYQDWEDYLTNNKIPKANMTFPKNGEYRGSRYNQVLLEERLSPECGAGKDIVKGIDITSSVISLASCGIAMASLIPAITIAPIFLTGALISGAGVGLYSAARSSATLHDRRIHKQSNSLKESEARSCYLNIAAGTAGVLTTGATKAATIAIDKGINISENAAKILLTVNAFNMTVASVNTANSLHSIINDFKNKKNPSAIDIIHFTTTALFFGNAVINLRAATTIYKQSHSMSFSEMVQSRSQDMWVKAKNIFLRSDVTTTDNNFSITSVDNVGDYCLKTINSIPKKKFATSNNIMSLLDNISHVESLKDLGVTLYQNSDNVFFICKMILQKFEIPVQEKLLTLLKWLLEEVARDTYSVINNYFPQTEKFEIYLNVLRNFIQFKATEMEIEYQNKKAVAMREFMVTSEEYDAQHSGFPNIIDRAAHFFKQSLMKMISANGQPIEIFFRELIKFFWDWLAEQVEIKLNQANRRKLTLQEKPRINCSKCGGYTYK